MVLLLVRQCLEWLVNGQMEWCKRMGRGWEGVGKGLGRGWEGVGRELGGEGVGGGWEVVGNRVGRGLERDVREQRVGQIGWNIGVSEAFALSLIWELCLSASQTSFPTISLLVSNPLPKMSFLANIQPTPSLFPTIAATQFTGLYTRNIQKTP